MNKPNFFIAGAPKCGTTALSEYLRTHPNIFMSLPKEPHYFAEDLPGQREVLTLEQYLKLFEDCTENHLAIGEASVLYLYSSTAINNIYKFNPDAKIIVMLRKPMELVYSFHYQLLYNRDETIEDFASAWKLQSNRHQGIDIPKSAKEPKLLQYSAVGMLGEQVEKLFNIFPSEQIKVILFEDFIRDTKFVYEDVLAFLEIPSDSKTNFPRINANTVQKSSWLADFVKSPPRPLKNVAIKTRNLVGLERLGILKRIKMANTKITKRPTLDANFQTELNNEFRDDIQKLSQTIGRDLSHWMGEEGDFVNSDLYSQLHNSAR